MKKYLLDTNVCIHCVKGEYNLYNKIKKAGHKNCYISEITLAELKYGVETENHHEKNRLTLEALLEVVTILPIFEAIDVYAKEKARLRNIKIRVDDFDLLIAATAIARKYIMVTNNTKDFNRFHGITLEDWTQA